MPQGPLLNCVTVVLLWLDLGDVLCIFTIVPLVPRVGAHYMFEGRKQEKGDKGGGKGAVQGVGSKGKGNKAGGRRGRGKRRRMKERKSSYEEVCISYLMM